jgi:hypothetical protein
MSTLIVKRATRSKEGERQILLDLIGVYRDLPVLWKIKWTGGKE